jgi:hypothetical protein
MRQETEHVEQDSTETPLRQMYCYRCQKLTVGRSGDRTHCEHCNRLLWEALAKPSSNKIRAIPWRQLVKWGSINFPTPKPVPEREPAVSQETVKALLKRYGNFLSA